MKRLKNILSYLINLIFPGSGFVLAFGKAGILGFIIYFTLYWFSGAVSGVLRTFGVAAESALSVHSFLWIAIIASSTIHLYLSFKSTKDALTRAKKLFTIALVITGLYSLLEGGFGYFEPSELLSAYSAIAVAVFGAATIALGLISGKFLENKTKANFMRAFFIVMIVFYVYLFMFIPNSAGKYTYASTSTAVFVYPLAGIVWAIGWIRKLHGNAKKVVGPNLETSGPGTN